MVNPSNSLTAPANNTRYQVKLHSTATETEPSKMSDSMKLATLGNNLKPFDNTMDTIEDFLHDFDRHTPRWDFRAPHYLEYYCINGLVSVYRDMPVSMWTAYSKCLYIWYLSNFVICIINVYKLYELFVVYQLSQSYIYPLSAELMSTTINIILMNFIL